MTKKSAKNKNVFLCLGGYVLLYVLYYCVITVVLYPYGISVALSTAAALVLTINSVRRRDKKKYDIDYKTALGLKKAHISKRDVIILAMLGIALNFVISGVLNILPSGMSQSYTESYKVITGGNIYGTVVVMAIVTPFLEEVFFRGVFQRKLSEKYGDVKGLVIGTCIFGIMHFNVIWSIYAAVIGFFLGCFYMYYKSVFPGVIVHCIFNLVSCVPLIVSRYETIYRYTFGTKIYVIVTFIIGIAMIYIIADRTWIKNFFDREYYKNKLDEVVNDED